MDLLFLSLLSFPRFIILAILIPYVLTGEPMRADRIFMTLALYDRVRLSMTLFFPYAISQGSGEKLRAIDNLERKLKLACWCNDKKG